MKVEWIDGDITRAKITLKSSTSRFWRRRYVTAEVERKGAEGYASWRFAVGGDRVCDHDDSLAQRLEHIHVIEKQVRKEFGERAKLKNPWAEVAELPPARTVKR